MSAMTVECVAALTAGFPKSYDGPPGTTIGLSEGHVVAATIFRVAKANVGSERCDSRDLRRTDA